MVFLRLIGFCLLAAAMVMTLRQMHPPAAALLCVAFGALVVGILLPAIRSYVTQIQTFFDSLGLDAQYYQIMLKAMGIVLVTQLAVQVCTDMDAQFVARRAELCGRLALLGVAMPVFIALTQMAVDVLR